MSASREFVWNETKTRAAVLVAEDDISDAEIAAGAGVTKQTLYNWKANPAFQARVDDHLREIDRAMMRHAIARRHQRIAKMQRVLERIEQVIDERGEEYRGVAGGESGLIVGKPIFSHRGDLEYEYKFDRALVAEYRALMEQSAKELGQLTEKIEHTGDGIVRQYIGVDVEQV